MKNESWWEKNGWIVVLILFSVIVVAYYLYVTYKEQEDKSEKEKAEELKLLLSRRKRYEKLVQKKKNHKRWLDWIFVWVFFTARLFIVSIGFLIVYSANCCYDDPTLDNYLTWLALWTIIFSLVWYLFFGIPSDIQSAIRQLKPFIENKVYCKYYNIDESIIKDESSIKLINQKIKDHNKNILEN